MINQKKVELMTTAAMYEHTRKISFKQNKYFEKNYGKIIVLKSIPIGFIISVLILFLVFISKRQYFLYVLETLGTGLFVFFAVLASAAVTAAYSAVSYFVLKRKFENMRGGYVKYRLYKKELTKMDEEDEERL